MANRIIYIWREDGSSLKKNNDSTMRQIPDVWCCIYKYVSRLCGGVQIFSAFYTLSLSLSPFFSETGRCSSDSYLSHDVSLTASVTVLLQTAGVTHSSGAVRHLAGRVADGRAALEVHRQLRQALRDGRVINANREFKKKNHLYNDMIRQYLTVK